MPEHPGTIVQTGLFTRDATPVPLEGVSVDAEISSLCARVAVSQRYVNRESQPIEAVYVFPLDEGAAVSGFEAIVDGTLVVGEVKDREDAFRMYDDAIERGDGAFLLDEERPDVFQASVGNLPPGKEVSLKITYVTELAVSGTGLRFTVPTTVSPRYAPAADQQGVGRPDSVTLNPPVAWQVPYGLNLSVQLNMTGAITKLESPSHPVSVTMNGQTASVTLSRREAALDRDFVLAVDVEGLDAPQARIERDDAGNHAVAVAFVPKFERATEPTDITFVVDRSGSMEGSSIEEVRNALQLCLRSMVSGCTFNIVGFGSTQEALFPENRAYNDESLARAAAHVATMRADLGGTEILPALQFAVSQPRTARLRRQVVLLTDGQVTNTDAVLALVSSHAADTRVFTFGIGAGASAHLVKAIARVSGGTAEFIHPGERIEPKVMRQFGRLLSPALSDVTISWGGLDARQAPSRVPAVFAGDRLLVYAFFSEVSRSQAPTLATLKATSAEGPIEFSMRLDPASIVEGRTVATLAARARIRELEESTEWTTGRGSRQHARKASGVSKEIVDLSVRYGLVSRETSFVAVERRETPVTGDMQLRRVPIALTAGWGGSDQYAAVLARPGVARVLGAPIRARASLEDTGALFGWSEAAEPMPRMLRTSQSVSEVVQRGFERLIGRSRGAGSPDDAIHAFMVSLVSLQLADGSWELSSVLAQITAHDLGALEKGIAAASGEPHDVRRAWATALAFVWLNEHAQEFEAEWRLAAAKARDWLNATRAVPAGGGSWLDAAVRVRSAASS